MKGIHNIFFQLSNDKLIVLLLVVFISIGTGIAIPLTPLANVVPFIIVSLVICLLSLVYINRVFMLMPALVIFRTYSLISFPVLRTFAGSVDIRIPELAVLIFWGFYLINMNVKHSVLVLTFEFKLLALLGGWVILSFLWTPNINEAVFFSIRLSIGFLLVLLCINIIQSKEDLLRIIVVWIIVATVLGVLTLVNFSQNRILPSSFSSIRWGLVRARVSLLGRPNVTAAFLQFGIALIIGVLMAQRFKLAKTWHYAMVFSLLLLFLAILVAMSRGVWISIISGIFIYSFWPKSQKNIAISILILIFLVAILFLIPNSIVDLLKLRIISTFHESSSASERIDLWIASIQIAMDQPLRGVGIGTFGEVITDYVESAYNIRGTPINFSHNIYLQLLVSFGVVGLSLYICFLGKLLYQLYMISLYGLSIFFRGIGFGLLVGLIMFIVYSLFMTHLLILHNWLFIGLCVSFIKVYRSNQVLLFTRANVTNKVSYLGKKV